MDRHRKVKSSHDAVRGEEPLDDEERQIMRDIRNGMYSESSPAEFKKQVKEWKEAVKNSRKKVPITFRIETMTLDLIKQMAKQQGLPYQTLISSVLFKFARDDLVEVKGKRKK